MEKLIHYRVYDTNTSLDVPLTLYRNALAAPPAGHPDRPPTLIQLAGVHLARFEKRRNEADELPAEGYLNEVIELSFAKSHENRAAFFVLDHHARRKTGAGRAGGHPP